MKRGGGPRAGWFWLAVVLLIGLSFSLWTNNGLFPARPVVLQRRVLDPVCRRLLILGKPAICFYWTAIMLCWLFPSVISAASIRAGLLGNDKLPGKTGFLYSIRFILNLYCGGHGFTLLLAADGGGFAKLINGILDGFRGMGDKFWETFWQLILAVPVAAYIFGLVAGSAHKRGACSFEKDSTLQKISGLRILPMTTVYILMGLLCTLYIVFIGSQVPYFFSAFAGQRPEGWQVYSEYARTGFFELCRIAVINLFVLTAANIMSQKHSRDSVFLKVLNALLAMLTLVLIATAFSKMALYIGAYGLYMRRLLPCVFMIFMSVICGGVIALQKWSFSITRLAVGAGVVMFCMLCLVNPDSLVAGYNADRYLSGTLENFDVEILYRSGPAGVDSALLVYEQTNDPVLQFKLKEYLLAQQRQVDRVAGEPGDNWESARARHRITGYFN